MSVLFLSVASCSREVLAYSSWPGVCITRLAHLGEGVETAAALPEGVHNKHHEGEEFFVNVSARGLRKA